MWLKPTPELNQYIKFEMRARSDLKAYTQKMIHDSDFIFVVLTSVAVVGSILCQYWGFVSLGEKCI